MCPNNLDEQRDNFIITRLVFRSSFFISLRDVHQNDTRVPGTNSIRAIPDFAILPHGGQLLSGDRPKIARENKRNRIRSSDTRHAIAPFTVFVTSGVSVATRLP